MQVDIHSACSNEAGCKDAITIGADCCIRGRLVTRGQGRIHIGDHVYIGGNSMIGACDCIEISDNVIVANDTHIMDNNNHPTEPEKREEMSKSGDYFGPLWSWTQSAHAPVVIEENVWVGEYSSILKGVRIGKGAVIACRTVVTKDVPPYTIVAGNPARVVKHLQHPEKAE